MTDDRIVFNDLIYVKGKVVGKRYWKRPSWWPVCPICIADPKVPDWMKSKAQRYWSKDDDWGSGQGRLDLRFLGEENHTKDPRCGKSHTFWACNYCHTFFTEKDSSCPIRDIAV